MSGIDSLGTAGSEATPAATLRRQKSVLYETLGRIRGQGLDDDRFEALHHDIDESTTPEQLQGVTENLNKLEESSKNLHEPHAADDLPPVPPNGEAEKMPPGPAIPPDASKLKYEAGQNGFLIVEDDGTKRKPSEAEEDQIIRTEMGDQLRDDVPQMEGVRVSDEELATLEGAQPAPEATPRVPITLDQRKDELRARLEAVKGTMSESHFNKLSKFITEMENDGQSRSMHQTLQYYEPKRNRARGTEPPRANPEPTPAPEPIPEPLPPERLDPRRFEVNTNADNWRGGAGAGFPHYYLYINPDRTYRRNPDGSLMRFTQAEVDRLRTPEPVDTPEPTVEPSLLDPTKFKRIRDTGPGGRWRGFGTPRKYFYIHPDAPLSADGSPKRFTEEEVEAIKARLSGGSPDEPTVGRTLDTKSRRGQSFEIDPKEYIGIRPKSLREIAANQRDQQFFGEMLASLVPGESADLLARAVQNGELTDKERKIVLYAQYEYTKYAAKWEKLNERISGKDVQQAMKRNPLLEQAVRLNDSEANDFDVTTKVWKQELMHMAMKDREAFDQVFESQDNLYKLRETRRHRNWEAEVHTLCSSAGVDPNDYDAVFNLKSAKDRKETRGWLRLNVQKDLTGFAKIAGALGVTGFRVNRMMKKADSLARKNRKDWMSPTSWVNSDIDKHMGTVARVMALTIGDPDKLRALTKAAMRNEEMHLERDAGPKTRQEAQNQYNTASRTELSQAKLQEIFNRDKPADWASWDLPRQEAWRDNEWNPPETAQGEQRLGMWAQIFSAFRNWLFDSRKKSLSLN